MLFMSSDDQMTDIQQHQCHNLRRLIISLLTFTLFFITFFNLIDDIFLLVLKTIKNVLGPKTYEKANGIKID